MSRYVVTGVTGQVAQPIAIALAQHGHDVVGAARFKDAAAKERLEQAGVTCVPVNLADADFTGVPSDVDHVLHFAVIKSFKDTDFDRHLRANAEATGLLMAHCKDATSFLYCSSTAVYEPNGQHPFAEGDPLGDNHRRLFPTYSIAKIATEAVVRTMARHLGLPSTIARLNVPYGDNGGWPSFQLELMLAGNPVAVHPNRPNVYNPIHEDDLVATLPVLLDAASVPATIVNWAGDQQVSIEEWCTELARLTGVEATFVDDANALESVACDVTRFHQLGGKTTVDWRDGMRRLVATRHPALLREP